jgi:RNA polymerase sigma factor (sigma-70 family)
MPTSTIEDNDRLLARLQAGDADARQEMIERNMPLVIKCVERMVKKHSKLRKHFDDLVGTGFLALTTAVDALGQAKQNTEAPTSPTGYLKTAIYHDLCEEISYSTTVRLPRQTLNRWKLDGSLAEKETPIVQSLDALQAEILAGRAPQDNNMIQLDRNLEHFETLEDVLQCCRSDLEREVVLLRAQGLTVEEVGQQVNRDKGHVARILSAIQRRYDSANLS